MLHITRTLSLSLFLFFSISFQLVTGDGISGQVMNGF